MGNIIKRMEPLTRPWVTNDPFLFCGRVINEYPASDGDQGVRDADLGGRPLGSDFSGAGGFNMYHGERVPGFPAHPHRGFETVTIVPSGVVDHADSLGATARYGDGDVQWLTAGKGVMHAEMFPLRDTDGPNPLDLYQIWLNLPAKDKMVEPDFVMLWDGAIPRHVTRGDDGATATVKVIAGAYRPVEGGDVLTPPAATPNSWASNPEAELAIWQVTLDPGARLTLPAAQRHEAQRTLFFERGEEMDVEGQRVPVDSRIEVVADQPLRLRNTGATPVDFTVLQAVPIDEPVVRHGPFVMNSQAEIAQAMRDFQDTQFGGWPWREGGPVHPVETTRFAKYPGRKDIDLPPPS